MLFCFHASSTFLCQALGKELLPHLPALLKTTATCAQQAAHSALKEEARQVIRCWKGLFPEELQAACEVAEINPKVLNLK
eukprot:symbB.v1.2.029380.t1/scaffold3206.1/size61198/6